MKAERLDDLAEEFDEAARYYQRRSDTLAAARRHAIAATYRAAAETSRLREFLERAVEKELGKSVFERVFGRT